MTLNDKVTAEMKAAMKAGDKLRLETLRSIRALILEFQKSGANRDITSEDEIKFLSSAAKKRKEAIEQYQQGGRPELAEKEQKELEIIEEFLPKQLSYEEIEEEVKKIAEEVGATGKQDFPKLMPAAIKALKGRADGKKVKSAVEKVLG